jgi:hypothetical protein
MAEKRDTPWLASVNIYDPHPPFNAPREYRDLFDPADMPGPLFDSKFYWVGSTLGCYGSGMNLKTNRAAIAP